MNEESKRLDEKLDRLLALVRAQTSPYPAPDPNLPARVRALSVSFGNDVTVRERPWAWASLVVAALILIGTGAYIGYGAASHSLSPQPTNDADTFITAISQSGFGDEIGRLHREDYQ